VSRRRPIAANLGEQHRRRDRERLARRLARSVELMELEQANPLGARLDEQIGMATRRLRRVGASEEQYAHDRFGDAGRPRPWRAPAAGVSGNERAISGNAMFTIVASTNATAAPSEAMARSTGGAAPARARARLG